MPTPSGGSISFLDLFNEFRGSGVGSTYSLSMADLYSSGSLIASTVTSVPTLGAISMNSFYGISKGPGTIPRTTIIITVASNTFTSNLNLYNMALRAGGYSTGNTDVVLYISSNAIVGSVGSSYTETVSVSLSSGSGAYTQGNLVNNSANMSDGAYWSWGSFNSVTTSIASTYGTIVSPNGTTSGVLQLNQTDFSTNDYFQQTQTLMSANTAYCISVWVKGFGSSIGRKVNLCTARSSGTAATLTGGWQRVITDVYSNPGTFGAMRFILFTNGNSFTAAPGLYYNNMLLPFQTVFLWGPQVTTSVSTIANQQYVETNGLATVLVGTPPTLTGSYNIYTTSETVTTSYAVAVPARFNSSDTVKIINAGYIVGESGMGGGGGGTVSAPVSGNPTPATGKVGGRGGDSLGIFRPVIIDNTGTIAGGGGGGGGGSVGPGTTPKGAGAVYAGGMGGGGAGFDTRPGYVHPGAMYPNNPGVSVVGTAVVSPTVAFTVGTGGIRSIGATSTATPGGNGGAIGTTGVTSTATPTNPGAAGGAPGHYAVGSPLVTWSNTGTRLGTAA